MIPTNEQPYPLPVDWQWTLWGKCGSFIAGSAFKKEFQGLKKHELPFYKVASLKFADDQGYLFDEADTITDDVRKALKAKLIQTNSLLFAKIGEAIKLNRRALNNAPCCIDNNLIAFVAEKILPRYAYYWSFTVNLYEYTNATIVPAIRKSDLEKIPIPLPPLDEQQRIVALLDELFADLDEAKTLAQAVVDGSKLRRAAILHKAFTGELSQLWRDEHGTTLGDWQWGTLNSVAECLDNLRSPVNAAERAKRPGKIPYYGATGQVGWIDDFLTDEQLVLLGEDGAPFLDMFKDKAYIIEGKAWVNNHAHILRSRFGNVGNKFLCHYLNVFDFSSYVNGTTRLKLTQAKMKTIPIPLPPPEEQKEIVRLLDDLLGREQRTKDHTLKTLDRVELMKKSILARAFRGELSINQIIRGRTTH